MCYSDVLLRSEENICSWHRNRSVQVLLLDFGTALQWPPKGRGLALSCEVLLSSWPLLFLTFHGLAAGRSVCSALRAMPLLLQSLCNLFLPLPWLIVPVPRTGLWGNPGVGIIRRGMPSDAVEFPK